MSTSTLSTVFTSPLFSYAVIDYIMLLGVVVLTLLSILILLRKLL